MKRTITAAAIAAGILITPAVASASVNVDDAGIGTVGKGDVQSVLGFNDAEMQAAWKKGDVKFSSTFKTDKDTSWTCSDGSTQHHHYVTTTKRPYDVTANTNKAGKLTNGWDFNGMSKTDFGSTTGVGSDGQRFPSYSCAGHGSFTGLFVNQTHTPLSLTVNGIDLSNTPVVA
jgi:hypothetical protein